MSVRLIVGAYEGDAVAMYDSVTGLAFGPVLQDEDEADQFLEYVHDEDGRDPRTIPIPELTALHAKFRKARESND